MDLRALQRPLKTQYRQEPGAALFTLRAEGAQAGSALSCSVDLGRALYGAEAHPGVGGSGLGACSGDLLLGALAACAQITCQMIAEGLHIPTRSIGVSVEGDLDLRGTLGVDPRAPVGFKDVRLKFDIDAPDATEAQVADLREKTEQYCVVLQTMLRPPTIVSEWHTARASEGQ